LVMPRVWRRYLGSPLEVPGPGAAEGAAPVPPLPQELDGRDQGPQRRGQPAGEADLRRRPRSGKALRIRQAGVFGELFGGGSPRPPPWGSPQRREGRRARPSPGRSPPHERDRQPPAGSGLGGGPSRCLPDSRPTAPRRLPLTRVFRPSRLGKNLVYRYAWLLSYHPCRSQASRLARPRGWITAPAEVSSSEVPAGVVSAKGATR